MFVHEDPDWRSLIRIVAEKLQIPNGLVEKDYWIMHVLFSLQKSNLSFFLKGGTSLSKGFQIIERFSEDIDILIESDDLKSRESQRGTKEKQIKKRKIFFDSLPGKITVPGSSEIIRDVAFDDSGMRNAGVRIQYEAIENITGLKEGVLLEVGFDDVEPYESLTISSWICDYLERTDRLADYEDNRPYQVRCYFPEYTFVEKLQTISTKYRQLKAGNEPSNFARHYYDIDRLVQLKRVQDFFMNKQNEYTAHKTKRFRTTDEPDLTQNEAFLLSDRELRVKITEMYEHTEALYFGKAPSIEEILNRLHPFLEYL